jgi:pheromone shutdown protein TraB
VKDFQELSKIESMKEFFRNKVIHLLMVVALTNVGSIIATVTFFAASPWLVHVRLFG